MKELRSTIPQAGQVEWIGLRSSRGGPINVVTSVEANEQGLSGDFFTGPPRAPRQVTLIQAEHIDAVARIMQVDAVDPGLLRRNLVVSGINLQSLKKCRFRIGDAELFATGNCPPCSKMEENLGPGGYNAMRGHGGITAYIEKPGTIRVGDSVAFLSLSGQGESD